MRFGARPDKFDARDKPYTKRAAAAQIASGKRRLPATVDYRTEGTAIKTQLHSDCVGQAVAAAAELLYWRKLGDEPAFSAWANYRLSQWYHDEWEDNNSHDGGWEAGTSIRGALKTWRARGMYPAGAWHYESDEPAVPNADRLAKKYPLRRYERLHGPYEIQHGVHSNGVVVATFEVLESWEEPVNGIIQPGPSIDEYHAADIVGYTPVGFVIRNSWGDWGDEGHAILPYELAWTIKDAWLPLIHNGTIWTRLAGLFRL